MNNDETYTWQYNDEYDRYDTGCDDIGVDQNNETPKDFRFKFCPFCGKVIRWED